MSISTGGGSELKTTVAEVQGSSDEYDIDLATFEATEDRRIHKIGVWNQETGGVHTFQAEISRSSRGTLVEPGGDGTPNNGIDNSPVLYHTYGYTEGGQGQGFQDSTVVDYTNSNVPWSDQEELHLHAEDDGSEDWFQVVIWYQEE